MIFFLKKSGFNLEKRDIHIDISSKFSKKEKFLLMFCLKTYEEQKKEFLEISLETIFALFKSTDLDIIYNSFFKLNKKLVSYTILEGEKIISKGFFHIFNIIAIEDQRFIFSFSKEICLSYEENNLFNRLNLIEILKFEFEGTKDFYFLMLKEEEPQGEFDVSLKRLKNILNISSDSYERFYDFEKKIFQKIIDDINNYTDYVLTYKKIKSGIERSNRVTSIKIKYMSKYHLRLKDQTNSLIKDVSDKIEDFNTIYHLFYNSLKIMKYDLLRDVILDIYINYETGFDVEVKNAIIKIEEDI